MSYDLLNGLRIGQRESFISTLYDYLSTSSPLECLAAGKFQQESHVTRTKQGEPSKTVESVGPSAAALAGNAGTFNIIRITERE